MGHKSFSFVLLFHKQDHGYQYFKNAKQYEDNDNTWEMYSRQWERPRAWNMDKDGTQNVEEFKIINDEREKQMDERANEEQGWGMRQPVRVGQELYMRRGKNQMK